MRITEAYSVVLVPSPVPPLSIIQSALNMYSSYLANPSEELKERFLEYANSLVKRFVLKGDFGVWPYNHLSGRARAYGCKIPWFSALAQGQGISVLLRAFCLHEDKKYLAVAKHALRAFNVLVSDGGVLSIDDDDNDWWYEEYASIYAKPSGVLNGFVFALIGIHEYNRFFHNDLGRQLFDRGLATLCHHIGEFDTDRPYKLSYYDRQKHIVSIEYHSLHIRLMEILYEITRETVFKKYQERWTRHREEFFKHRMYRCLSMIYYLKSGHVVVDSLRTMSEMRRQSAHRLKQWLG